MARKRWYRVARKFGRGLRREQTRLLARVTPQARVIARATTHWAKGEDLRVRFTPVPTTWQHQGVEDREVYQVDLSGYQVRVEVWPGEVSSLRELEDRAYADAEQSHGPIVRTWPVRDIRPDNAAAEHALPTL
jgi:hypothetical protein